MNHRIVSGVVLAGITLACVHWGGWPLLLLALAAAVVMVQELNSICGGSGSGKVGGFHYGLLAAIVLLAGLGHYQTAWVLMVAGALYGASIALQEGRPVPWPLLTPFYIGLPCLALFWLRNDTESGATAIYFTFAVVWASDTGAYAIGKAFGGPRFSPQLSPKKTWAGFAGGCLAAVAVGFVAAKVIDGGLGMRFLGIAVALSMVSQAGDLLESAIKRYEDLKDSGTIVPGHGGLLDTIDGLLTALPAAAVAVYLLKLGATP